MPSLYAGKIEPCIVMASKCVFLSLKAWWLGIFTIVNKLCVKFIDLSSLAQ